jgi:hypothetical protein
MKIKKLFFLIIIFSNFGFSQVKNEFAVVDSKMSKIPQAETLTTTLIAAYINANFKNNSDKIRAVFFWTASNISYDVEKLKLVQKNPNEKTSETAQDRIDYAIANKKGVCANYADVFNDIANKLNIQTFVVEGYTKIYGKVANLSHAWCVSKINGKWLFFDPTWGSGYVNDYKYFKKIDNQYFNTEPIESIKTHIPFDYLWQFLNYPITNQEFYDGKTQINKTKEYFDFETELQKYLALSDAEKAIQSAKRIEKNGLKNNMILQGLSDKKSKSNFEIFNSISINYNQAIQQFNDYVAYRNKQFKPNIADEELKKLIENPRNTFIDCQERIDKMGIVDEQNIVNVKNLKSSLLDVKKQVDEQYLFVNEYLSKGKLKRKLMFTKISWFGIPIN